MNRRLILPITLTSMSLAMLGENVYALEKHYIKATPQTCVTTAPRCEVELSLSWQGAPADRYCLEIATTEPKRICDIPNRAHQFQLSLAVASDVMIYLVRQQDFKRVAQVAIEVQRHSLNQKRRKVAWSIF